MPATFGSIILDEFDPEFLDAIDRHGADYRATLLAHFSGHWRPFAS